MEAYVLISLEDSSEREILQEFQAMDKVLNANILFGEWDLILNIKGENPEDISNFVIEKVRSNNSVQLTSTLIVAA